MPRGVPASGKRRTRAETTATDPEAALALSPFDDTVVGDGTAAFEEDPAQELAAADDELSEDPTEVIVTQPIPRPSPAPLPTPYPTPLPVPDPVPDAELTADQLEIKRLRDQLARERGRKDAEPEIEPLARPGDSGNIVIHFLEDGLTVNGKVMYRGEELEFEVGAQPYKDTFNRNGVTWLDLRFDEFGQVDRWGKIMFRSGPWPGKTYMDGTFENLRGEKEGSSVKPPTMAELEAAEKLRQRRAAPRLPAQV